LIPDYTDRVAVQPGESDDDVGCEVLVHLIELAVVDDHFDDVDHVVRLIRGVGDDRCQALIHPVGAVERCEERRNFHVVLGEEREEVAHLVHRCTVVRNNEVGHSRPGRVRMGTAELLHRDVLTRHGLDDLGARDEQV